MTDWPLTRLSEVLEPVARVETVEPTSEYRLLGVRLDGQGPFLRETVLGTQTAAVNLFQVRKGDFIYSRLFAWRGAFGIINDALDGCYVSGEFPTFVPAAGAIDIQFLSYWFRLSSTLARVTEDCTGSTPLTRNRFKENFFLALEIPLPPLLEQRRIVAQIEELSPRIDEARALRKAANEEADRLIFAGCEVFCRRLEERYPAEPLFSLVDQERGISYGIVQTGVEVEEGIPTLRAGDLRWFGVATTNVKMVSPAIESRYQRTRLRGNELLLRIRGGVGELAVCPKEMIGGNVSREIAVIPLCDHVDARYAMYLLAAPSNQARMAGHVKGTSYVGINLKDVRTLPLPVPPIEEQRAVVSELNHSRANVNKLKHLQAETAVELNALLPSILDHAFRGEL